MREQGLLRWQWENYPDAHQARRTLVVHLLTAPLFVAGSCALLSLPFTRSVPLGVGGLLAMLFTAALQGRMHKLEKNPPLPFLGPLDVVMRLVAEQWITFPRFVLSGRFAQAWRAAGRGDRPFARNRYGVPFLRNSTR